VTDTDVSIERVNLALYDSYVVTGPKSGVRPRKSSGCILSSHSFSDNTFCTRSVLI
jgi:hypothetical protein